MRASKTIYTHMSATDRLRSALDNHAAKTLSEAKTELNARLGAPDLVCPCCGQKALIQPRRISRPMAQQLSRMFRAPGHRLASEALQEGFSGGDRMMYAMLRHWGLARPVSGEGSPWQLTPKGVAFVQGSETVPRIAYTFNKQVKKFSPDRITFMDALMSGGGVMED